MSEAARSIPHFSYVEEVDISALHAMREHLNARRAQRRGALELPAVHRRRAGARA